MLKKVIDISKLDSNVLDLKLFKNKSVYLKGEYTGARLIVRNAQNVNIHPLGVVIINTTHEEDALILQAPDSVIFENRKGDPHGSFTLVGGGLTVWGDCKGLMLRNFNIHRAHTGIRINQPGFIYKNITIEDCIIEGCSHEGIYIGTSRETAPKTQSVRIRDVIVRDCLWDGIQTGNTLNVLIENCLISSCGLEKIHGQDFDITINPGSIGHIKSTEWTGKVQFLDSRVFLHK